MKIVAIAAIACAACIAFIAFSASDIGAQINMNQSSNDDFDIEVQFMRWMAKYERSYADKNEYLKRFDIYRTNYHFVNRFDSDEIEVAINEFADLSEEEFAATRYTFGANSNNDWATCKNVYTSSGAEVPHSWDARDYGMVNAPQNQGSCGSCWAFSAVAALEAEYFRQSGDLVKLSEQALVDCSKNGNHGCRGGLMDSAFDWVEEHGIPTAADYPYKARDQTCKEFEPVTFNTSCADVHADNKDYDDGDQENMARALMEQGVLSIAVAAGGLPWQFYFGGVIKNFCGTGLNHGIALVGWNTKDNGDQYWIARNSWGKGWGNGGYVHIYKGNTTKGQKGGHGVCGINMNPAYPIFQ